MLQKKGRDRKVGTPTHCKRNPNKPRTQTLEEGDLTGPEMAASSAVEKLKALWDSQVNDEEQWAVNYVRTPFPSHPAFSTSS